MPPSAATARWTPFDAARRVGRTRTAATAGAGPVVPDAEFGDVVFFLVDLGLDIAVLARFGASRDDFRRSVLPVGFFSSADVSALSATACRRDLVVTISRVHNNRETVNNDAITRFGKLGENSLGP